LFPKSLVLSSRDLFNNSLKKGTVTDFGANSEARMGMGLPTVNISQKQIFLEFPSGKGCFLYPPKRAHFNLVLMFKLRIEFERNFLV
jgi:hypothetical protein